MQTAIESLRAMLHGGGRLRVGSVVRHSEIHSGGVFGPAASQARAKHRYRDCQNQNRRQRGCQSPALVTRRACSSEAPVGGGLTSRAGRWLGVGHSFDLARSWAAR